MPMHTIEGVLFLFAALIAAIEIPSRLRHFRRWLQRRLKPVSIHPLLWKALWVTAMFSSLILIPAHAAAYAVEAGRYLMTSSLI